MRKLRWVVAMVLMALSILFLTGPYAQAEDDSLVASEPKPKQELDANPGWVTLAFDHEIDPSVAKMLVLNEAGENVTVGTLIVEGTNVTTQLKDELPKGTYTIRYRINREDGQVRGGAFQFAVGKGTWTNLPDAQWSGNNKEPDVLKNPDPNATEPGAPPTPEVTYTEPTTTKPGTKATSTSQATEEPVETEEPTEEPSASPPPTTATPVNDYTAPLVVGGLITLAILGGGAYLLMKRNSKDKAQASQDDTASFFDDEDRG